METIKNIITDSGFISNSIIGGIIFTIVFVIINKYKTKVRFYKAVLGKNYTELLRFLMITSDKKQKGICYPHYTEYIERGLRDYFDSRLNLRVTSSRVTRIQDFFDCARNIAPHLDCDGYYWKTIINRLKEVVSDCGPNRFASYYVYSLANKNEEKESEARAFLLTFYNECANSKNETEKQQFSAFINLINEEIDKYQNDDVTQEKKDFLIQEKLFVKSSTTTSTRIWATTNS